MQTSQASSIIVDIARFAKTIFANVGENFPETPKKQIDEVPI